jgi:hypothetical protein
MDNGITVLPFSRGVELFRHLEEKNSWSISYAQISYSGGGKVSSISIQMNGPRGLVAVINTSSKPIDEGNYVDLLLQQKDAVGNVGLAPLVKNNSSLLDPSTFDLVVRGSAVYRK